MSKSIKKASILVCGSSDFTDKNFVFSMLSLIDRSLQDLGSKISVIHTSGFSGASKFAKIWVDLENERNISNKNYQKIEIKEHTFDLQLEAKNHSFYEDAIIPQPVLNNDTFYKKGQEQILKSGVNYVMAFPNNTGKMGPSTANIKRFAELSNITVFNCAEAYRLLQAKMEEVKKEAEDENIQISQPTLTNRRSIMR